MEVTSPIKAQLRITDPLALKTERRPTMAAPLSTPAGASESHAGYGMPCAKCRAYYPSDMQACPICGTTERVSPTAAPQAPAADVPVQSEQAKLLAEERERLRELKSQIYASHPPVAATTLRCVLDQNHNGNVEPAAVCHSCYAEMRQQADRMEAALHMDTRDAERIVYDAVWADTSDPNKTYANAANALLVELRKRAGIGLLLGSNQRLTH